jgi:integrase
MQRNGRPAITPQPKPKAPRAYRQLTDSLVDAAHDFAEGKTVVLWDSKIPGLRVRVGKHKTSWSYFQQHQRHGKRSTTCTVLGSVGEGMNVADARKAALVIAGRNASGRIAPGKRSAKKFGDAFADYLQHLERKATKAGKPPTWKLNVEKIGKSLLLPEFEKWPLADMSAAPAVVADFHRKVSKQNGPVQANHAARIIRAVYGRTARLDRTLPPHSPASAVEFNDETPQAAGRGLAFKDFPKWAGAWRKIDSPIRRSYHLTNLLTGCRPGELARLRREDIRPSERAFILRRGKAGSDIRVILSVPIVQALRMALKAHDGPLVFPGMAQVGHREDLPARGVALRRTYRTVAADVGIDEMLAHFLLSHAPAGISQRYVARMILQTGPAMRTAQRRISRRILDLLQLKPPDFPNRPFRADAA